MGRTIFAISAVAALALAVPAAAPAATTMAYVTPDQTCTTKDAAQPNTNAAPRPSTNPNGSTGSAQTQMTARMPSGAHPNDFPMLQTFPTVYTQPVDKSKNAPKTLPVSTCQ